MLDWKFVSIITYIVMYKIIIANSGIATNAITLETFFKLYALALVRHIINRTTIVVRLARITNKYLRPAHHRDDVGTAPGPVRRQGQRHRGQYLPPAAGVLAQKGKAPVKGGAVI